MANFQKSAATLTEGSVGKAHLAQTEIGMAHFAGSGCIASKCKHCSFFIPMSDKSKKRKCSKFVAMTGNAKKAITGVAYACKYFEAAA